jgi:Flp pilus assembly protein TadG
MISSNSKSLSRGKKRRGLAAVELAFLLPLILFFAMATVDFSRMVYMQVTLQNCARNGAIYEFYTAAGYAMPSNWTSLSSAVTADESGLTITATATSPKNSSNNYVTVTATTTFTPISLYPINGYPSIPSSITLTQTATMPFPASTAAVP